MIALADSVVRRGGNVNRILSDAHAGEVDVHQLNCTYYSALGGDDERYLAARAIQLFARGVPQIYYVGLLAGENDHGGGRADGRGPRRSTDTTTVSARSRQHSDAPSSVAFSSSSAFETPTRPSTARSEWTSMPARHFAWSGTQTGRPAHSKSTWLRAARPSMTGDGSAPFSGEWLIGVLPRSPGHRRCGGRNPTTSVGVTGPCSGTFCSSPRLP